MFHWKLMLAMFVLILFIIINKREPFDDISRNILIDKELTNVHGKTLIDLDNDKLIASNLGYISQINTENTNYPLQGPILIDKTTQKDGWNAMYNGPLYDTFTTVQETLSNASTAIGTCLLTYYSAANESSNFALFQNNPYGIKPPSAFIDILNRLKASFVRTTCAINMHNYNIQTAGYGFVYRTRQYITSDYPNPINSPYSLPRYMSGYLNLSIDSTYTAISTKQIFINTINKDTSDYKGFIYINRQIFDDLISAYATVINNNNSTISVNTTKHTAVQTALYGAALISANVGDWAIYQPFATVHSFDNLNYINDSYTLDIRAFPRGVLFGQGWYSIKCRDKDYWSDSRNGFYEFDSDGAIIKADLVGLGATVRAGWEAFYLHSTGSTSYFKIKGNNSNNRTGRRSNADSYCRDYSDRNGGMKCVAEYDGGDTFYIQEIDYGIYSIRGGRSNKFLRYDNVIRSDRDDTSSRETHFIIEPITGAI